MESSNSMVSNSISRILECPICFQQMSEPKMLPCRHTFCLTCLKKMAAMKKIQCALCQRKHELPKNGVKGLSRNETVFALLEHCAKNKMTNNPNPICVLEQYSIWKLGKQRLR